MDRKQLGDTGLSVSPLCLGTWQMSGMWGEKYDAAIEAVSGAFDLGINFFDTAYAYGWGAAETALAKGLGDLTKTHRDELVITTKGGVEWADVDGAPTFVRNSDPGFLREKLELSLKTLGLDYVDIFFIHWPDPTVPFEETAAVVEGFRTDGLVRFAGLSNFSIAQMDAYREGGDFSIVQLPYNLLQRGIEQEVLPYCKEGGKGVMGYAGLAHGLLTGALSQDSTFKEDDWRSQHELFQGEAFRELIEGIDEMKAIAKGYDCTLAQLSLAWIMQSPAGIVPIIGAEIPEHLEASAQAVDVDLSAVDAERLVAIADRVGELDFMEGGVAVRS